MKNNLRVKNQKFKVVSLFTGCGGLDLGFKKAGYEIIFATDKDEDSALSYRANFDSTPYIQKDITIIKEEQFPKDADVLIAGVPCQSFTRAGKQDMCDSKTLLYKEFNRALKIIRPKIFLVENVEGLLDMNNGKLFSEMLFEWETIGYKTQYKVLDAKNYGIPQDRRRLIVIGLKKSLNLKFQYPQISHGPRLRPFRTLRSAIQKLEKKPGKYYLGDYNLSFLKNGYSKEFLSGQRKRPWDKTSYCIVGCMWNVPLHPSGEAMKKVGYRRFIFDGDQNRTLSIKECLAIQTFPYNFQMNGSLKSQYQQVGNAVPPLLSLKLAFSIKRCLEYRSEK